MSNMLHREAFVLERKDDNGNKPDKVMEEVTREVKSIGGDVKKLQESMQNDLAEVRKIAEEAKTANSPEIKSQIEALTTSVGEKHAAIEKVIADLKEQADAVETALNRSHTTGDDPDAQKKAVDDALRFFEGKMAASGNLTWGNRPTTETADIDGYKAWENAFPIYLRAHDERVIEAKALSVGINPNGGYLVPTARSSRMTQKIYESSPIRQLAMIETIGTDSLEIPYDLDEAGTGWVGETQSRAETDTPTVGEQKIPVHEMYAKPKATQKFLEDASIDVEAWLARKVGEKMGRTEATAFVNGNGVLQPRGILTYAHGTSGARDTIRQVASGAAATITGDIIVKMPWELKGPYLANATWLMKRSTVQAVMLLKDGDGQYMWRPGLTAGAPSTLVGFPVSQADDMPVVGANNLAMAFGDFRRGYTVVDRLGITTLRDPYSAKPYVEFYTRKRVGGAVVDFEAFAIVKVAASV